MCSEFKLYVKLNYVIWKLAIEKDNIFSIYPKN